MVLVNALTVSMFVLAAAALGPSQVAERTVQASIARIFGRGAVGSHVRADSADVLRVMRGDSLLGFAQIREARGKEQPITFLVAIDPVNRLKDVDILVYREPYGGEVAYESWRRQFRGQGVDAPLVPGRDIRSISGATISVNAVTTGVRLALRDLVRWRESGVLR